MRRLPPRSPLTAPLFPYTPLFRSALAGLDALAGGVVAAGLRLGLHAPQVRSDDGMGDHQAQRDLGMAGQGGTDGGMAVQVDIGRSEEHTSELQSIMRISYAVFCLKKNKPIHI